MAQTSIAIAAQRVGGQAALARALGIQPALVYQWITGRRPLAAHHCLTVERVSGVSRHDLRPDVFGPSKEGG